MNKIEVIDLRFYWFYDYHFDTKKLHEVKKICQLVYNKEIFLNISLKKFKKIFP